MVRLSPVQWEWNFTAMVLSALGVVLVKLIEFPGNSSQGLRLTEMTTMTRIFITIILTAQMILHGVFIQRIVALTNENADLRGELLIEKAKARFTRQ
jgi:hypothetical protein